LALLAASIVGATVCAYLAGGLIIALNVYLLA
jgi:hypothetical protein